METKKLIGKPLQPARPVRHLTSPQEQCSLSTFKMNIRATLSAYKVELADVRRMECKPFLKVLMNNSNISLQLKKRELNTAEISC